MYTDGSRSEKLCSHLILFTFWYLFFNNYIFFYKYSSVEHVGAVDRDPHGFRSGRGDGKLRDQALSRHRGQSLRGTFSFIIIKEGNFLVSFFKGLVTLCHSFCIFFSVTIHTLYNHSLITFAEALLNVFIVVGSVVGTSLGCRAEIRTRACLTASQRTTN
jgi:hypothetical protein